MKYKIGDEIIFTSKEQSNKWKKECRVFLYEKVAKIIYIYKFKSFYKDSYLLEFKDPIGNDYDGGVKRGKKGHCSWWEKTEFKSIDHIKFKKWIKG